MDGHTDTNRFELDFVALLDGHPTPWIADCPVSPTAAVGDLRPVT
nr:hypothetical protein [Rhodococcus sp. (in: high G+C Gram-positive bacteria)]